MPTIRQKKLAKIIVESTAMDNPPTNGEMLEQAGYGKGVAKSPARAIESPGVQKELEVLGFTPLAAKQVVSRILNDESLEPNARLKAADMTFKVHGSYAPDKQVNVNLDIKDTLTPEDMDLIELIKKHDRDTRAKTAPTAGQLPERVGAEQQDKDK